ncbi:MAG: AEC family transporter, partial [Aristaeellaceae bacterium]
MTVLLQVLTLGLLMLCGLIAVRFRVLDQKGVGALNTFVLNFAQVGLIISKLQQDSNPDLVTELAWMFVLTCLTIGLSGVVASRLFRREEHDRRAVLTCLSM